MTPPTRPAPPRSRRARRILAGALAASFALGGLATSVAWVAWVAFAPPARADEADDLREELATGGTGQWGAVMRRIKPDAGRVGVVLGPVFKDRGDRFRAASPFCAAFLADDAARDREPLLFDDILRRAADDAAWTQDMLDHLAKDGTGRTTVTTQARRRLLDPALPAEARIAAAYVLRFEPTLKNARELAGAWRGASAASSPSPAVAAASRDSLDALLGYRFESAAAAEKFFEDNARARDLLEWVRALSLLKDRPDSPVYSRMVAEARENIERVGTPAGLQRYVSTAETPFVEIRRHAARRAAKLERPGDEWVPVLTSVLETEHDAETLRQWLEVTARVRVTASERAAALARLVTTRLSECCGSPDLQRGLLGFLGSVGDPTSVGDAFDILADEKDAKVLEQLLSVAGATGGNESRLAAFHERHRGGDPVKVALRVAAIDAMARGAAKGAPGRAAAGTFLRGLLAPRDPQAPPTEPPSPPERSAAVRWLGDFPGAETVARLAEVAREKDGGLARVAAQSLGKLAGSAGAQPEPEGATEAVRALVELARAVDVGGVRVEAVRQLAKVPATAAPSLRLAVVETVRTALAPGGPPDLPLAGAQTAAALRDEGSLEAVFALAVDGLRPESTVQASELTPALERLVRAVAKDLPQADERLSTELARLGAAGGLDSAISLAKAAADDGGGRLALQVVRARLLADRADVHGRDEPSRKTDLQEALSILNPSMARVPPEAQKGPLWTEAMALKERIVKASIGVSSDAAMKKTMLFAGVEVAVQFGDGPHARWGLTLVEELRGMELTADERATLDRFETDLRRYAEGVVEPPK